MGSMTRAGQDEARDAFILHHYRRLTHLGHRPATALGIIATGIRQGRDVLWAATGDYAAVRRYAEDRAMRRIITAARERLREAKRLVEAGAGVEFTARDVRRTLRRFGVD